MKAALIPPIPLLHVYGHGPFHLLLSHLMEDKRYFNHYMVQRALGAYLVLDNSAHEFQVGQQAELLREQALLIRAQEVVVPDVLEDAAATVEAATCALEAWFEDPKDDRMSLLNPALMYVPQAKTQTEWTTCLMDLVSMHKYIVQRRDIRSDFVIGISKDYENWPDGIPGLLRIAHEVVQTHKAKVHLLGWGRKLWDLGILAREYTWVRSTDSAKPFVYALEGIELEPGRPVPVYPGRPDSYFNRSFQSYKRLVANKNVQVFRDLAEGKL